MINVARYHERGNNNRHEELDLNILHEYNTSLGASASNKTINKFIHYSDKSLRSNMGSTKTTNTKLFVEN
jgi:hypothetical protein